MTICPCCGLKSDSVSVQGRVSNYACQACGARAVGEPLPRPEHELPSYGRSLLLAVTGALLVLVFVVQTLISVAARAPQTAVSGVALSSFLPMDFGTWVAAAETASWRLKWIMIPVALVVFFGSRKIYQSITASPARFCGVRYARRGYLASASVPLLALILIGVTVPERLRHRQRGIEAASKAQAYRIDRALVEYQQEFGTLPSDLKDLSRLPDADGSIASLLKNIDAAGYTVNAEVAAVPKQKPRTLRGAVISKASLTTATDDTLGEGLSFTNYELRLPGSDKILGNEDDLLVRDGVIYKASETPRRGVTNRPGTKTP
ncbi:MAG: hypothetical protein ABR501_00150 [Pyrinomonadaceae bacterium]